MSQGAALPLAGASQVRACRPALRLRHPPFPPSEPHPPTSCVWVSFVSGASGLKEVSRESFLLYRGKNAVRARAFLSLSRPCVSIHTLSGSLSSWASTVSSSFSGKNPPGSHGLLFPAWPGVVTHSAEGGWGFLLLSGTGPLQGHSPKTEWPRAFS